ncbi:hypothetical protein H312_00199 [Anncaliia algerae PRA339]|uniref:Extracellular membrane protein CFEM domain-containing protein n=1 Tax=Anncaliia algerae PRA339 TaxID=1288291 RepID=A0A059F6G7_9MICR|nr:hypothetical protein H312_00199 [Anncaliia algerae PRA339]
MFTKFVCNMFKIFLIFLIIAPVYCKTEVRTIKFTIQKGGKTIHITRTYYNKHGVPVNAKNNGLPAQNFVVSPAKNKKIKYPGIPDPFTQTPDTNKPLLYSLIQPRNIQDIPRENIKYTTDKMIEPFETEKPYEVPKVLSDDKLKNNEIIPEISSDPYKQEPLNQDENLGSDSQPDAKPILANQTSIDDLANVLDETENIPNILPFPLSDENKRQNNVNCLGKECEQKADTILAVIKNCTNNPELCLKQDNLQNDLKNDLNFNNHKGFNNKHKGKCIGGECSENGDMNLIINNCLSDISLCPPFLSSISKAVAKSKERSECNTIECKSQKNEALKKIQLCSQNANNCPSLMRFSISNQLDSEAKCQGGECNTSPFNMKKALADCQTDLEKCPPIFNFSFSFIKNLKNISQSKCIGQECEAEALKLNKNIRDCLLGSANCPPTIFKATSSFRRSFERMKARSKCEAEGNCESIGDCIGGECEGTAKCIAEGTCEAFTSKKAKMASDCLTDVSKCIAIMQEIFAEAKTESKGKCEADGICEAVCIGDDCLLLASEVKAIQDCIADPGLCPPLKDGMFADHVAKHSINKHNGDCFGDLGNCEGIKGNLIKGFENCIENPDLCSPMIGLIPMMNEICDITFQPNIKLLSECIVNDCFSNMNNLFFKISNVLSNNKRECDNEKESNCDVNLDNLLNFLFKMLNDCSGKEVLCSSFESNDYCFIQEYLNNTHPQSIYENIDCLDFECKNILEYLPDIFKKCLLKEDLGIQIEDDFLENLDFIIQGINFAEDTHWMPHIKLLHKSDCIGKECFSKKEDRKNLQKSNSAHSMVYPMYKNSYSFSKKSISQKYSKRFNNQNICNNLLRNVLAIMRKCMFNLCKAVRTIIPEKIHFFHQITNHSSHGYPHQLSNLLKNKVGLVIPQHNPPHKKNKNFDNKKDHSFHDNVISYDLNKLGNKNIRKHDPEHIKDKLQHNHHN